MLMKQDTVKCYFEVCCRCHAMPRGMQMRCDRRQCGEVQCSAVHQIENEIRTERKKKPSDMIVTNDERCMI